MAKTTKKPETKPAPKPAPKVESKPPPKQESKPAPKPTPKPESKPAPKAETKAPPASQKKTTGKGAMAKDPSTPTTTKRGNWQFNGQWVDKEGYKVDGYGKRLRGQSKPFVPAKQNPFAPKASTPTTQAPAPGAPTEAAPAALTPQQQIQGGLEGLVKGGIEDVENFDPRTFQDQYEPQFEQGMQRAYDTIYGQFERKNQDLFAQQNQQLQQSLVERGLDPSGDAYKALTKQLSEQQASARQDAQNAAWQAAQGYQQQGFNQATGTALLPGQMAAPYLDLYGQQQQGQIQGQLQSQQQGWTSAEAEKQRKFEAEQEKLRRQQAERLAKSGGGGGGNNAAQNAWAQYIMNQYQQPQQGQGQSTLNAGVAGAAQGIGAGLTAGLMRQS